MIDMKTFYGWASILMFIALGGNMWNLVNIWNNITIGAKIAQIAGGILFNALLCILFYGLWKITPKTDKVAKVIDSPDLDAIIKKYENMTSSEEKPRKKVKRPTHNTYTVQSFEDFTSRKNEKELHI